MFLLLIEKPAQKKMRRLDEPTKKQVDAAINKLKDNPYCKDSGQVASNKNNRKIKAGRYRVIYTIDKKRKEVVVVDVKPRNERTYK